MQVDDTNLNQKMPASHTPSSKMELQDYKKVTISLTQDALSLWAELWSELQGQNNLEDSYLSVSEIEFCPSCGMPQFLEKMWLLKHYLEFIKRYKSFWT